MSFSRIKVSEDATKQLSTLKGRLKVTPNFICRMALCTSLEETGSPNPAQYDQEGQEFNRYTLTGEYDPLFSALVREKLAKDGLEIDEYFDEQYRAHLNRGIATLFGRVKGMGDLVDLVKT